MKSKSTILKTGKTRVSKHQQVTMSIRESILNGEWKPETLLPSMHELGERFNTSFFTIQTALKPLEEEGLIEKKKRVGTIVKHNAAVLTSAAIYCHRSEQDAHHNAFRNELTHQLTMQLTSQNVNIETFVDPRPEEQRDEPLPSLLRAVENNEVQALLVTGCDQYSLSWLKELPVASSFVSGESFNRRLYTNYSQLLRLGLQQLYDRGCRTIGLISSIRNSPYLEIESYERQFYRDLIDIIGDIGLKTRDSWMAVPEDYQKQLEQYGYNEFMKMCKQPELPDGILVYPDVAARGVITASLQMGISVPEDLQLVLHCNSGVEWFCPLAVDWLESDTVQWAEEMINHIRKQKAGEQVTETSIDFNLLKHEG